MDLIISAMLSFIFQSPKGYECGRIYRCKHKHILLCLPHNIHDTANSTTHTIIIAIAHENCWYKLSSTHLTAMFKSTPTDLLLSELIAHSCTPCILHTFRSVTSNPPFFHLFSHSFSTALDSFTGTTPSARLCASLSICSLIWTT